MALPSRQLSNSTRLFCDIITVMTTTFPSPYEFTTSKNGITVKSTIYGEVTQERIDAVRKAATWRVEMFQPYQAPRYREIEFDSEFRDREDRKAEWRHKRAHNGRPRDYAFDDDDD